MRFTVAGIGVDPLSHAEVVARVVQHCKATPRAAGPLSIFSCNVDMVARAERDPSFAALLSRGSIVTADGMPIVWLSRLAGAPIPERVTGADLVPALCREAAKEGLRVYFFGAAPGVADRAAARLAARAPGLRLAGVQSPPMGFERDAGLLADAVARIRDARPDLVFVALGAPKQERFILEQGGATGAGALLGIGGALDMASGGVRRAPRWVQRAGAEWLFRLGQEPRRLAKRYLVDDRVFARVALRELWARRRP